MEPMPKVDQAPLGRDHAAEFHGLAGWPAQPKLVPTVIVCAPWLSKRNTACKFWYVSSRRVCALASVECESLIGSKKAAVAVVVSLLHVKPSILFCLCNYCLGLSASCSRALACFCC